MSQPYYFGRSRTLSHVNTKAIIVKSSAARECGMSAQQGDICHSPHPALNPVPGHANCALLHFGKQAVRQSPGVCTANLYTELFRLHQRACYTISITSPKGATMDIQGIVAQLKQEASRLQRAIAALVGPGSQPARRGRPPKVSQALRPTGKRRTMSAAARAKIAAAQRARWAKQKVNATPGKTAPNPRKPAGRKPMSAAARDRLSALMKARWAAKKKNA